MMEKGAGNSHSLRFSMSTQVFAYLFTSISFLLMCDVKTVLFSELGQENMFLVILTVKKTQMSTRVKHSIDNIVIL